MEEKIIGMQCIGFLLAFQLGDLVFMSNQSKVQGERKLERQKEDASKIDYYTSVLDNGGSLCPVSAKH